MAEPLIRLGDLAALAWAVVAVLGVPALLLLRWWTRRRRPPSAAAHETLLRARLLATERDLSASRAREAQLLDHQDKLARHLSAVADERDAALNKLNKLDEVAQRLERCSCGIGRAIAEELNA